MRCHSQNEKCSCWIVDVRALESYEHLWIYFGLRKFERYIHSRGGVVYRHPTRMTLLVEAPKNRLAPATLSLLDRAEQRTFGERWPNR